jgi:prepilin-type processing-associated H-X9-DG protein
LIELLVVISIIVLLIGILLPALAKSRKAARTVACQSRFKQQAVASNIYAGDHNQYLPNYYEAIGNATTNWQYDISGERHLWVGRIYGYLNQNDAMFRCPDFEVYPGRNTHPWVGPNTQTYAPGSRSNTSLALFGFAGKTWIDLDYNVIYQGTGWVTNVGYDLPHPRLGQLNRRILWMQNKGESDWALLAESRHSWLNALVNSIQRDKMNNWIYLPNMLADGLAYATKGTLPSTPYYTTYLFSAVHNGSTNVPFADGHVRNYSIEAALQQAPF